MKKKIESLRGSKLIKTSKGDAYRSQFKDKDKDKDKDSAQNKDRLSIDGDDEYALAYYDSDSEKKNCDGGDSEIDGDSDDDIEGSRGQTHKKGGYRTKNEGGMDAYPLPKIIYCSRTHSQLNQFVNEIKSTEMYKNIRLVSLGSRKNFCINHEVNRPGVSDSKLTEICLEMQKHSSIKKSSSEGGTNPNPNPNPSSSLSSSLSLSSSTSSSSGAFEGSGSASVKNVKKARQTLISSCQFKNKHSESSLANRSLAEVNDIEEIVSMGKEAGICPYYSSKRAVRNAEVICVPYNMLIQQELRDSLGISLKNSVILFDEAHNLVDIINQVRYISTNHIYL